MIKEGYWTIRAIISRNFNILLLLLQEREKWVSEIEQQILTCLQSNFSGRDKVSHLHP